MAKLSSSLPTTTNTNSLTPTGGVVDKVALLVDISASMAVPFSNGYSRLRAVGESINKILRASDPNLTHYSLIAFDTMAETRVALTRNYGKLVTVAKTLSDGGGTYYGDAIDLATKAGVDRMILLSDGQPADKDIAYARAQTAAIHHIRIDCIGVGDADGHVLRHIAELAGGTYSYADTLDDLQSSYVQLETRELLKLEKRGDL